MANSCASIRAPRCYRVRSDATGECDTDCDAPGTPPLMATFSVRFLGCKVSQADATLIRDALVDAGHVETTTHAAQVHVVNTCALTVEAERKSRQQVNRASRAATQTFVTGCAANLNADQFDAPNVTVVRRSADRAAVEIVEHLGGQVAPLACLDDDRPAGRTRAFIKVQNGCDQRCSFCIIPQTRGVAESRSLDAIMRDASRRIDEGHPELVLTGINIGTWTDERGRGLEYLVERVAQLDGLSRLRISSIEPGNVTRTLVQTIARIPLVARHLHVPLQSADDAVLASMGRSYTVAQYEQAIDEARQVIPGLNVTTDVIIGYPTENEQAFARTYARCERLAFGKVHVFPFSPRPGTVAADLGDHVAATAKADRSARLRDLSDRMAFARRQSRVGQQDAVILERRLDDGTLTGYGSDYSRFVLDADAGAPGDLVAVRVAAMAGEHLRGEPCQ